MDCFDQQKTSLNKLSNAPNNVNANYQIGNNYVRVFYRISAAEKPNWEHIKLKDSTVFIRKLQQLKDSSKYREPPSFWEFITDGIFHNCTQEEIYDKVVGNLLEKLNEGNNAIIVGFGQTGTGKSSTITGLEFLTEENYGLAPRLLKKLLQNKKTYQNDSKMSIDMTYLEFAKNLVFDLFKKYPNEVDEWHANKEATRIKVLNEMLALKELHLGEARKQAKSSNNYFSHINTSILTFYVKIEDLNYSTAHQIHSRIHLIDLAGIDTVGNLTCVFKNKCEVGSANLTKTSLEQFFLSLIERSPDMIRARRRTNPFIYFLKDDLNIQSSLRFIGHISTSKDELQIALSMMRFGQLLRGYKPTGKVIEQPAKMNVENKMQYLQRQIQELEEERIQNSILLNEDLTTNIDSERMEHLQKTVKDYLNNQISEIDVLRISDTSIIFKMFRDMYSQWENDKHRILRDGSIISKRTTDSELSLHKKRGSARSSSTMTTAKSSKDKHRRYRKSKDALGIEKHRSLEKADKEISVQSFFDVRNKSQNLRGSQDRSSGSNSQIPKRKKSKFSSIVQNRPSLMNRRKSASNFNFGVNPDMLLIPESVPENVEAWSMFTKEQYYISFIEDYKANEKNIVDAYTQYLDGIKILQEEKNEIDAMKQEMLEAKLMSKYRATDDDEFTEIILSEAEAKCLETKEKAQLALLDQKEIVLRYLTELKSYLNNRNELRKLLSNTFDSYCRDKFNIPIPQDKSLSLFEMMRDSIQSTVLEEFEEENIVNDEKEEKELFSQELELKHYRKLMAKERTKVMKMRSIKQKVYNKYKC